MQRGVVLGLLCLLLAGCASAAAAPAPAPQQHVLAAAPTPVATQPATSAAPSTRVLAAIPLPTPTPTQPPTPAAPPTPRSLPAVQKSDSLEFDGVRRSFLIRSPEHLSTEALPVIIVLHGAAGTAQLVKDSTRFSAGVDSGHFIAVWPNGSPQTKDRFAWNAGSCCGRPVVEQTDDIGFLAALFDRLEERYQVDPARIYLAGFSNGGMLAYRAACELGTRVAGIAVVSGDLNVDSCPSANPVPLIIVHGTADPVVPYAGGNPIDAGKFGLPPWVNASVADAVAAWTVRNGCTAPVVVTVQGILERRLYPDCAGGSFVDVYTIKGGGHDWPRGSDGVDATRVITDRFLS